MAEDCGCGRKCGRVCKKCEMTVFCGLSIFNIYMTVGFLWDSIYSIIRTGNTETEKANCL